MIESVDAVTVDETSEIIEKLESGQQARDLKLRHATQTSGVRLALWSSLGIHMWAEICSILSDSEGFSPGTPVFLPP